MTGTPTATEPIVAATERFLNRELSWLAFNDRVLEEALDPKNPLLERLRFLTIFHTNLDEFFMVRVSGLKEQDAAALEVVSPDGLSPRAQLGRISDQVRRTARAAHRCWTEALHPALAEQGVRVMRYRELEATERAGWDDWYARQVHPILTPLAVGPTLPFPFISNLSLNLALHVESGSELRLARMKIPLDNLPRLVALDGPGPGRPLRGAAPPIRLLPLEDLIAANLHTLFPGVTVHPSWAFRVTRDADFEIKEDEADDLLRSLQKELRQRRFGHAIRLEVEAGMPPDIRDTLRSNLNLEPTDVYEVDGLLGAAQLVDLCGLDLPQLRYPPFVPARPKQLAGEDMFAAIRSADTILHHPFDSFLPVVEFARAAANDAQVVAIKQTLYRTSGDSPIIGALEEAIENRKQVAAVVELKARFDEENNIVWAQRLEESGVHVIYGVPGLKTHAKLMLVVRREEDGLRRYAHIGTGNYNPTTARVYTDLGLFTADPAITADVADVFNMITGFARPPGFRSLLVAPRFMKAQLLERIAEEAACAERGEPARILFKCNALTHRDIIEALYAASASGVQIQLLVRGICNLVPGVPGMSERIEVRSVVGRFLEHSRVYWFHHGGRPEVYIGSADLMERNLERRIETLVPVRDPELARWIREVHLERYLSDRQRTRVMQPDGAYVREATIGSGPDVHNQFLADLGGHGDSRRARTPPE